MRRLLLVALLPALAACTGVLSELDPGGGMDGTVPPGTDGGRGPDASVPPGTDGGPRPDAFVPPGTDGGPRPDAFVPPGVDGGPPPPLDAGSETPVDAGPCAGSSLADALTVTPIAGAPSSSGRIYAAPTAVGGALIAHRGGGGVHLTRVDGAGAMVGADVMVDGNAPWGVALNGDAWAVLVDRGSDEMVLVGTGPTGAVTFETRLLGAVPHDVTNNEWFGTSIRAGDLTWTGSQWAAYVTVNRLWPDGIAHYGDTLRLLAADGTPASGGWGWGCSHSMEVQIAHNGTSLGPVCVSDCYPDKGVFFNHRTEMFLDPSGNCAGRVDTRLGGVASVADGFWIDFVTPEGRGSMDVALQHVANDRSVGPVTWLTADGAADANPRLAPYDGGLIAGYTGGGVDRLQRVDASGAAVGAPVDVPAAALGASSEFVALAGGDVAWVTRSGGGLAFARLRVCR